MPRFIDRYPPTRADLEESVRYCHDNADLLHRRAQDMFGGFKRDDTFNWSFEEMETAGAFQIRLNALDGRVI